VASMAKSSCAATVTCLLVCLVACSEPPEGTPWEPDAGPGDAGPGRTEGRVGRVRPARGPLGGGTRVVVEGGGYYQGFATGATEAAGSTTVWFGEQRAPRPTIIDDDTLEVVTPPNLEGPQDVVVENPNGRAVCPGCFTYWQRVVLTGISPAEGPLEGGTELELTGRAFTEDLVVVVGGRLSPKVEWIDETRAKAVVPRGASAGTVDVRVQGQNGFSELRWGFTYLAPLAIERLEPAFGSKGGREGVRLVGTGLSDVVSVRFGDTAASFSVLDDHELVVSAPPSSKSGPVDVTVATASEWARVSPGFVYLGAGELVLWGIMPSHGPKEGGNRVSLVGRGLHSDLRVRFGALPARGPSGGGSLLEVSAPRGRANSTVAVWVSEWDGSADATAPQAYRYDVHASHVAPAEGTPEGGETVVVHGEGLEQAMRVWFGAYEATEVVVLDSTRLQVVTPRGAGRVDLVVRHADDPTNQARVEGAFLYRDSLTVAGIVPDSGAIAGGERVTILGTGFSEGTQIDLGTRPLCDLQLVDDHTLVGRVPPGEPGVVDLVARQGDARSTAAGAFFYFDPKTGGGSSGGPLNGTLNVTVLDTVGSNYGSPLPGARVVLGPDANTPLQGLTDRRGQITFSEPDLLDAQTVTVSMEGYATVTVTHQQSQNLTIYLSAAGAMGDPGGPATWTPTSYAIVAGRVTGFKLPRLLGPTEKARAEVWVAPTSSYGVPPLGYLTDARTRDARGERWRIEQDGGSFSVITSKGLRALYAVFGIHDTETNTFTPLLMGVRRAVNADPEKPAVGMDIVLDMHLDMTVPVTFANPQPEAIHEVYAWLELGAAGAIPLGRTGQVGDALRGERLPRLHGENVGFLASAEAGGKTWLFHRQLGDLSKGMTVGPLLGLPRLVSPAPDGRFSGELAWGYQGDGALPDLTRITLRVNGGQVWSAMVPGEQTRARVPAAVWDPIRSKLKASDSLGVDVLSVRSPRFDPGYWTYAHFGVGSWTAWTEAQLSLPPALP